MLRSAACIGIAATACLTAPVAASAQKKTDAVPPPFRVLRLEQVDTDADGRTSTRRPVSNPFYRAPGGRLTGNMVQYCTNPADVPAIFKTDDSKEPTVSTTYTVKPLSGRFRCLQTVPQQIEYKTSMKVEGDRYTLSAVFVVTTTQGSYKTQDTYTEDAVLRFIDSGCTVESFRSLKEETVVDGKDVTKKTRMRTSDANSTCAFFQQRKSY